MTGWSLILFVTGFIGIVGPQQYILYIRNEKRNEFCCGRDFYCDVKTKKTTKAMQEKNPDLVLALGDLSEVKNPDCFFDLFSRANKTG